MACLIVSNGHGEDSIALHIIKAIQKRDPSMQVQAFPLVGEGRCFKAHNIDVVGHNPIFPSGGFIRSLSVLLADLKAGLWGHIRRQRKQIKDLAVRAEFVFAVGDVFCLMMARKTGVPVYFLPTAKSSTFMPHSVLERFFIRRWAVHSFPRDQLTTDHFLKYHLPASFFGNPMMDRLRTDRRVLSLAAQEKMIAILPGSRQESFENLVYILRCCECLHKTSESLRFVCAYVKGLDLAAVADRVGASLHLVNDEDYRLTYPQEGLEIRFTTDFLACINQAHMCIGLAGTANEQALYLGKPVLCFEGFGPQSTLQRFREQQRLMGDGLHICEIREYSHIVQKVLHCLQVPKKSLPADQSAAEEIVGYTS